jgi:hypothetical protein
VLHDVEIQHGTTPLEHSEHIAPPLYRSAISRARCTPRTGVLIDAAATKQGSNLESAGIEFIDENGGGPGVRLKKRQQKKKV